jgi:DCN1-like protein 1/2
MLAIAYELHSPRIGSWTRTGWTTGWSHIGADSLPSMKSAITTLRSKFVQDPDYFQKVYVHTFDFVRAGTEGGRSLGIEIAIEYWRLLLPAGLQGGALAHIPSGDETYEEGWTVEYIQWWLDFLSEKGAKGVSKDTWIMVISFFPLFLLLIFMLYVTVSGFRADN